MSRSDEPRRRLLPAAMVGLSLLLGAACTTGGTTVAYKGPEHPKEEQASLETDRILVESIDDLTLHGKGGSFVLLPGPHELSVRFDKWEPGARLRADKAGPVTICFVSRRERAYLIRPTLFASTAWGPEIIDQQTHQRVAMRNPIDPPLNCARKRVREPAPE